jgi:pimeloyl-ACP methyl ester carboxylesterase
VRQELRFCSAPDGTRLAYAVHGRGAPLVRTATWLTHLEFDWQSPLWRHWLEGLADGHTVIRYDERGCGLSDRNVEDVSLDARVADLEAVIDAAGTERVALLGISQGGPLAIAFAARHPDRVNRLMLFATFARGRLMRDPSPSDREQAQLMSSLIRMGWGQGLPAFRRLFTTLFIPDASPEQMEWFDELQRVTADPEIAVRIRRARNHDDVTDEATRVACPALVIARSGRRSRSTASRCSQWTSCTSALPRRRTISRGRRSRLDDRGDAAATRQTEPRNHGLCRGEPRDSKGRCRTPSASSRAYRLREGRPAGRCASLGRSDVGESSQSSPSSTKRSLANGCVDDGCDREAGPRSTRESQQS